MPRLVHFTLRDGRSIVAGYDESAEQYVGQSANLVFISDDRAELLPLSAVRECHVYEAHEALSPQTKIFDFAFAS